MIGGKIGTLDSVRYTPAGIPIVGCKLAHESEQLEAGIKRKVQCEFSALAVGDIALQLAKQQIGDVIEATGFFAPRPQYPKDWILHIVSLG